MKHADDEAELTRLLASERAGLADSVAVLRQHGPDATELASLASRLALQGIDVAAHSPAGAPKTWKKWLWAGGGGVAVVALSLAWRAQQPPRAALPPPLSSVVAPVVREAAVVATPSAEPAASRATNGVRSRANIDAAVPGPSPDDVEATPAQPVAPTTPQESVGSTASAASAASPRPLTERQVSTATRNNGSTASAPLPAPVDAAGPTEVELLRDARSALRSAPARALALADEHARRYPRGKLTQERELIAISALVALGRRTAALSRGASFEAQYPTSPYRKQVGELLR